MQGQGDTYTLAAYPENNGHLQPLMLTVNADP
jgi:hypothetical protein